MDTQEFNAINKNRKVGPVIKQIYYDPVTTDRPLYVAYAVRGSLTSQAAWTVEKIAYDGSGNVTGTTMSAPDQIADNYAGLTYA